MMRRPCTPPRTVPPPRLFSHPLPRPLWSSPPRSLRPSFLVFLFVFHPAWARSRGSCPFLSELFHVAWSSQDPCPKRARNSYNSTAQEASSPLEHGPRARALSPETQTRGKMRREGNAGRGRSEGPAPLRDPECREDAGRERGLGRPLRTAAWSFLRGLRAEPPRARQAAFCVLPPHSKPASEGHAHRAFTAAQTPTVSLGGPRWRRGAATRRAARRR